MVSKITYAVGLLAICFSIIEEITTISISLGSKNPNIRRYVKRLISSGIIIGVCGCALMYLSSVIA